MSALIQLGLGHLEPESSSISVERQNWLSRFETADEWIKKVFEGVEKLGAPPHSPGAIGELLEKAAPWIESSAKAVPPAHLLFEVVSALVKLNDPRDLAILACTVAYQTVTDRAVRTAGLPASTPITKALRNSIAVSREEFAYFTIEGALTHPFVRRADEVLEYYAARAGFEGHQLDKLVAAIHSGFREEFRLLITDGENDKKFAPLRNWLGTDSKDALIREALRRHVQYISWLYAEAPLLDEEPYALQHIYIDTGCGILTRKQLQEKSKEGGSRRDAFKRDDENGGVHSLLDTVLGYLRSPEFNDVIVVQGSAGAGKSTFAKYLAHTLARDGLTPLLVRLRDAANISKGFYPTIDDALRYEDEVYLRGTEHFQPPSELFSSGTLFTESVRYYGTEICPYVLILDGWDEISLDVTEGYKQKVQSLLSEIRREFRRPHPRVRVILTGRPSDAIDTAESFFRDATPVLTVREMTPEQLEAFAGNIRKSVAEKPLRRYTSSWQMPTETQLQNLFDHYRDGFAGAVGDESEQVLGVPFLAQLAFRVMADSDGEQVTSDSTALLRRITEITVHHARSSSEDVGAGHGSDSVNKVTGKKLHGPLLRTLLHRTAAKMTISGRESVSHEQLSSYLQATDEGELMKQAEQAGGVTGLLIAFFFKGGRTDLGCEFTHKALREYLFAEAVVETIKRLALSSATMAPLVVRPQYWADFDLKDPRQQWSRDLAELLAPQSLTPPVKRHILNLLEWEITRTDTSHPREESTQPLTLSQWIYVRDGMADAYDWWTEGVALRPQLAAVPKTIETQWEQPFLVDLIESQTTRPNRQGILTVAPPRVTTYDGHLGAALMQVTAAIHYLVGARLTQGQIRDRLRDGSRVQSQETGVLVSFRPGGLGSKYFAFLCARVKAVGHYAAVFERHFPSEACLWGADLRGADLQGAELRKADLRCAYLDGANLCGADLRGANLSGADLRGAYLDGAELREADLRGADLRGARLRGAFLNGADLSAVDLSDVDLSDVDLTVVSMSKKDRRRWTITVPTLDPTADPSGEPRTIAAEPEST